MKSNPAELPLLVFGLTLGLIGVFLADEAFLDGDIGAYFLYSLSGVYVLLVVIILGASALARGEVFQAYERSRQGFFESLNDSKRGDRPRCLADDSLACVPIGGDPICIKCRAKKEAQPHV